jgi:hypothetical protein
MLHRVFELIRPEDTDVQKRLMGDAHLQELAQSLGIEDVVCTALSFAPNKTDSPPYARNMSQGYVREDVSQKGESERRHAVSQKSGDTAVVETDHSSSGDQPTFPAPNDIHMPSLGLTDSREQYRIFCSRGRPIPKMEAISIFGKMFFPPHEMVTTYGSITFQQEQMLDLRIPEYLIQPILFDEERCPMAAVYIVFRDYGRRKLAVGMPLETVLGSPEVDLSLYFRERRPEDLHTPSTWACEYMRRLKDFDVYVALACIFTYARFMRVSIGQLF